MSTPPPTPPPTYPSAYPSTYPPPTEVAPDGGDPGGPRVSAAEVRHLAGLRRSRSDKKLGGVAAGIAHHLDIDPIIVRVTLVVLIFFGGAGLIVYLACWLLVPLEGDVRGRVRLDDRNRSLALALAGVVAVLSLLGDSLGSWSAPWPLVVLGVVVVVVLLARRRDDGSPAAPTSYEPTGPTASAAAARRARPGPVLFWYAVALIAIGVGVLGSLELAGVDVVDSAYPATGLVTCGALLALGAVWGRPGGLIALGLLSAVATAAVTAGGTLDTGQISRTPTTSSALLTAYSLDVGEIVVDLREVRDLEGLDGAALDLDVDLGRVEVIVPAELAVVVTTDLGAGDRSVFGVSGDVGTETTSSEAGPDAPELTIDVRVGVGDITITREEGSR